MKLKKFWSVGGTHRVRPPKSATGKGSPECGRMQIELRKLKDFQGLLNLKTLDLGCMRAKLACLTPLHSVGSFRHSDTKLFTTASYCSFAEFFHRKDQLEPLRK